MTSSNGNIFRVTGPLWGESIGHRWSPLTKASDADLSCFLWFASEQTVDQTIETLVIWDTIVLIMTSLMKIDSKISSEFFFSAAVHEIHMMRTIYAFPYLQWCTWYSSFAFGDQLPLTIIMRFVPVFSSWHEYKFFSQTVSLSSLLMFEENIYNHQCLTVHQSTYQLLIATGDALMALSRISEKNRIDWRVVKHANRSSFLADSIATPLQWPSSNMADGTESSPLTGKYGVHVSDIWRVCCSTHWTLRVQNAEGSVMPSTRNEPSKYGPDKDHSIPGWRPLERH